MNLLRSSLPGVLIAALAVAACGGPQTRPPRISVGEGPRDEDVTFRNGDVTLAGTLSLPNGDGPHPSVVLVSGGGPQDRDHTIPSGYEAFRVISVALVARGIAVLRYDDRGVGASTGDTMASSPADWASDVEAALRLLQARPDVDRERIGIVGHSAGAMIASMVAERSDGVAFVVAISHPALPGVQALRLQREALARMMGSDDARVAREVALLDQEIEAARMGEGWDAVEQAIRAAAEIDLAEMPAEQRAGIGDPAAAVEGRVQQELTVHRSPSFRWYVEHDPTEVLRHLRVPILGVFGGADPSVSPAIHREPFENALRNAGNEQVVVQVIPDGDHFLMNEDRFADGFVDTVGDWVTA